MFFPLLPYIDKKGLTEYLNCASDRGGSHLTFLFSWLSRARTSVEDCDLDLAGLHSFPPQDIQAPRGMLFATGSSRREPGDLLEIASASKQVLIGQLDSAASGV